MKYTRVNPCPRLKSHAAECYNGGMDDKVCRYIGCGRKARSLGACEPHRKRERRGTVSTLPVWSTPDTDAECIRLLTVRDGDCLAWVGGITSNGYGIMRKTGEGPSMRYAHRVAYELEHGPIPVGMEIDHLCRNRKCVEPTHLEAVAPIENWRRGNSLSAQRARMDSCDRGHQYTSDNTYYRLDSGTRMCRACSRMRDARRAGRDRKEYNREYAKRMREKRDAEGRR